MFSDQRFRDNSWATTSESSSALTEEVTYSFAQHLHEQEGRDLHENKGTPDIRWDEVDGDSTRYDIFTAAPPDEQLVKYWFSWAGLALVVGFFSLTLFLSLASNKTVRSKPFNLYLIYLIIPDFTFSILCGITCLMNAVNGEYWSHAMCNFQQLYVVFGFSANCWLNAIVAKQLHSILRDSHDCRRHHIPSAKTITKQALAVYAFTIFLGLLGIIEAPWFPHESGPASGLACVPREGEDTASSLFFWLCFFPLFAGIPILFVMWIIWDVYRRKLLPPSGKRRLLSIYFARIIVVFLIMWLPIMLMMFLFGSWLPPWAHFIEGTWSHLQGAASAGLILQKPDIKRAFVSFVTFGRITIPQEDTERPKRRHGAASDEPVSGPQQGSSADLCFDPSTLDLQLAGSSPLNMLEPTEIERTSAFERMFGLFFSDKTKSSQNGGGSSSNDALPSAHHTLWDDHAGEDSTDIHILSMTEGGINMPEAFKGDGYEENGNKVQADIEGGKEETRTLS